MQESMIKDVVYLQSINYKRQKELEEMNMALEHNIQQVIQDANLEIQGIF